MPYGDKKSYSFFKIKGWSPFHQDKDEKPKKEKKDSNPCNKHFLAWNEKCNKFEDGTNEYKKCRAQRLQDLVAKGCA